LNSGSRPIIADGPLLAEELDRQEGLLETGAACPVKSPSG
jgi:hypothetical protein